MKHLSLIYSEENFEKLKEIIRINIVSALAEKPVSYSVEIDKAHVIWRTSDPEIFSEIKKFLTKDTEKIIVSMFVGRGSFNLKYVLENVKASLA